MAPDDSVNLASFVEHHDPGRTALIDGDDRYGKLPAGAEIRRLTVHRNQCRFGERTGVVHISERADGEAVIAQLGEKLAPRDLAVQQRINRNVRSG